jgi:hypothetical protein
MEAKPMRLSGSFSGSFFWEVIRPGLARTITFFHGIPFTVIGSVRR